MPTMPSMLVLYKLEDYSPLSRLCILSCFSNRRDTGPYISRNKYSHCQPFISRSYANAEQINISIYSWFTVCIVQGVFCSKSFLVAGWLRYFKLIFKIRFYGHLLLYRFLSISFNCFTRLGKNISVPEN